MGISVLGIGRIKVFGMMLQIITPMDHCRNIYVMMSFRDGDLVKPHIRSVSCQQHPVASGHSGAPDHDILDVAMVSAASVVVVAKGYRAAVSVGVIGGLIRSDVAKLYRIHVKGAKNIDVIVDIHRRTVKLLAVIGNFCVL